MTIEEWGNIVRTIWLRSWPQLQRDGRREFSKFQVERIYFPPIARFTQEVVEEASIRLARGSTYPPIADTLLMVCEQVARERDPAPKREEDPSDFASPEAKLEFHRDTMELLARGDSVEKPQDPSAGDQQRALAEDMRKETP